MPPRERKIRMKKIKKYILLTCIMALAFAMQLGATEVVEVTDETVDSTKPLIALGADLSEQQRSQVLGVMGVSEADLGNYNVIYITNDMERQYLGSYIDASVIGSKSLSSVMITPKESGHGVLVTTENISYCTTGMYRNALLTAGVEDADILVVGPSQISGTAALIGAVKGYELLSGEAISDETLDIALNEMITTGELTDALDGVSNEDIEALIAYIKAKLAAGELETDEDIRTAIEEGENQFGVSLNEGEIQQIIDVMNKIKKLGLDPSVLLDQAADLYEQFGSDFLNHIDGATIAKTGIGAFFSEIGKSIKNFFTGLFQ